MLQSQKFHQPIIRRQSHFKVDTHGTKEQDQVVC